LELAFRCKHFGLFFERILSDSFGLIGSLGLFQITQMSLRAFRSAIPSLHGSPPIESPYVRGEAGSHRYNVGTDTCWLCATSRGGVPLASSFLAA
jgi:hypothetical protein